MVNLSDIDFGLKPEDLWASAKAVLQDKEQTERARIQAVAEAMARQVINSATSRLEAASKQGLFSAVIWGFPVSDEAGTEKPVEMLAVGLVEDFFNSRGFETSHVATNGGYEKENLYMEVNVSWGSSTRDSTYDPYEDDDDK